ncbi:MAG: hypothetical protein PHG44_00880 [Lentisphaeria bacterium]|jgi:hypothetical protein|nr:hypothetical protein [Lentisphaeria bacterium]MDY0175823.1 hypothetical protein [Lentisphaeria bacterium]
MQDFHFKYVCRLLLLFFSLLGAEASSIEIPLGSKGLSIVLEEQDSDAQLLAIKKDGLSLLNLRLAPLMFERLGLGWQGTGSEWIFAEQITNLQELDSDQTKRVFSAEAIALRDLPGERPYRFKYRVSIFFDPLQVHLDMISITGLSRVPVKMVNSCYSIYYDQKPLKFSIEEKSVLIFEYEGLTLRAALTGENASPLRHTNIISTPPQELWLEKDVEWESFAASLIWTFEASRP